MGDPRRRRKVLPLPRTEAALPQHSMFFIAFSGNDGIEYDIVFARCEAEAHESRPGVIGTRLFLSGDHPQKGTSVQFLHSVRDHGGLEVLLALLANDMARFALELNSSSVSASFRAAD